MTDARLSTDGPTRWAAVAATRTRCRGCTVDIIQLQPGGRWRDVEHEASQCTVGIRHEPLPIVAGEDAR